MHLKSVSGYYLKARIKDFKCKLSTAGKIMPLPEHKTNNSCCGQFEAAPYPTPGVKMKTYSYSFFFFFKETKTPKILLHSSLMAMARCPRTSISLSPRNCLWEAGEEESMRRQRNQNKTQRPTWGFRNHRWNLDLQQALWL